MTPGQGPDQPPSTRGGPPPEIPAAPGHSILAQTSDGPHLVTKVESLSSGKGVTVTPVPAQVTAGEVVVDVLCDADSLDSQTVVVVTQWPAGREAETVWGVYRDVDAAVCDLATDDYVQDSPDGTDWTIDVMEVRS